MTGRRVCGMQMEGGVGGGRGNCGDGSGLESATAFTLGLQIGHMDHCSEGHCVHDAQHCDAVPVGPLLLSLVAVR